MTRAGTTEDVERFDPSGPPLRRIALEHRARYHLAKALAAGSAVLDLGCGEGYGTAMIADAGAERTVGLELSLSAGARARRAYGSGGASFVIGDARDESDRPATTFEIDTYDLSAEMMADWHSPEIFRAAVRAQKTPDAGDLEIGSRAHQLAEVLRLAGAIARILPRSTVYRDAVSSLLVEADRLGIAPDTYHEVFDSISLVAPASGELTETVFTAQPAPRAARITTRIV